MAAEPVRRRAGSGEPAAPRPDERDAAADLAARALVSALHAAGAALFRLDPGGRLTCVAAAGPPATSAARRGLELPVGDGFVGRAVSERRLIMSDDAGTVAAESPRWLGEWIHTAGSRSVAAMPLLSGDRALGALVTLGPRSRSLVPRDGETLRILGGLAAVALESVELREERDHQVRAWSVIESLSRFAWTPQNASGLLDRIAAGAQEVCEAEGVTVTIGDPASSGRVRIQRGAMPHDAAAARHGWADLSEALDLAGRNDDSVRVARRGRPFTARDRDALHRLAGHAAIVLDAARRHGRDVEAREEAQHLLDVAHVLSQSLEPAEVWARIADSARRLVDAQVAVLYRLEPDGSIAPAAAAGVTGRLDAFRFPEGAGLVGLAVRVRRGVATSNLLTDRRIDLPPVARALIESAPYRAALAVPLISHGRAIGALSVADRPERVFDERDIRRLQGVAEQAAIAMENSRLYRLTQELVSQRERIRLAGELHDTLSQLAFSVALHVDWCVRHCPPESPLGSELEEIRRKTGAMMEQIRRLIAELSEDAGRASSLFDRLAALVEQFQLTTRLPGQFVGTGDPASLGPATQDRLYTWLQEILALFARRSRLLLGATLRLALDDDTVRFEIAAPVATGATAMAADALRQDTEFTRIRARIEALGGRLRLEGVAGPSLRLAGSVPATSPGIT
jgi:GAF domain-containing protein